MSSERALRREIELWVEGATPPAPWLEQTVIAAVRASQEGRHRTGPRPQRDFGALGGFGSGLRLAAGLAALLIAVGAVAALLMGARLLHNPTVPGRTTTTATPSSNPIIPFNPSPAVRASNWPPGGPVPSALAGAWHGPLGVANCGSTTSHCTLHLGGYSFQVGEETPAAPDPGGTIGPALFGNVVVNGSEIDFISDICTLKGDFGFERFTYTMNGDTLVLTRAPGPGQSNCVGGQGFWSPLAGTYSRVSTP
jgi:hypothetical protein